MPMAPAEPTRLRSPSSSPTSSFRPATSPSSERPLPVKSGLERRGFEEGVAEYAVGLGGSFQRAQTFIERLGIDDSGRECAFAHSSDHRGEGPAREGLGEIPAAAVDIDHPWRDPYVFQPGLREDRVELAADIRMPPARRCNSTCAPTALRAASLCGWK